MTKRKWLTNKFRHLAYSTGEQVSGFRNTHKKRGTEKKILLFCSSRTMEEHLVNFMEQLEDQPQYTFYLCFGDYYAAGKKQDKSQTLFRDKKVTMVTSNWQLYMGLWDLIACADLELPFWVKKGTIPTIYVCHGSGAVSYDNGATTYDYGSDSLDKNGQPIFDVMLEPNKETAKFMSKDPVFGKTIRSGGYRYAWRLKEASEKKEEYKKELGIAADRKVVSVWGSWGEESLFHMLGEELFTICEELKQKGYEFIFSIHPREYQRYDEQIEPLGEKVEACRERGMLVRSPQQDWLPYMMASDVVLIDYSAMLSLAVLAGKKIIQTNFPEGKVWRRSMYAELRKVFPVISRAEDLEAALEEVLGTDKYEKEIQRFQSQLYASKEDYKKFIQDTVQDLVNR